MQEKPVPARLVRILRKIDGAKMVIFYLFISYSCIFYPLLWGFILLILKWYTNQWQESSLCIHDQIVNIHLENVCRLFFVPYFVLTDSYGFLKSLFEYICISANIFAGIFSCTLLCILWLWLIAPLCALLTCVMVCKTITDCFHLQKMVINYLFRALCCTLFWEPTANPLWMGESWNQLFFESVGIIIWLAWSFIVFSFRIILLY